MRVAGFFRSIQSKLIIMVLLLILIAVQLIGVYFISTMKTSLIQSFTANLNTQANLLTVVLSPEEQENPFASIEEKLGSLVRNFFNNNDTEVQVLDPDGKILAASHPGAKTEDYVGRKNTSLLVSRALQGVRDNEAELVNEEHTHKKVIAKPIFNNSGKVSGAIYIVASMQEVFQTMGRINQTFVSATLIALGLTAILGVLLAGTITAPIKALTKQASVAADGKFDKPVPVYGNDEISQLSVAFNEMMVHLSDALSINEEEREKLSSILSNMNDGVLATDEHGRVIIANSRAEIMLGMEKISPHTFLTKLLNISMNEINQTLKGRESSFLFYQDVAYKQTEQLVFRVVLTPIWRREKTAAGVIAVLQDVTEAQKLEQSRREFVANVSHELRTPLTTIKSYVEALEDGALEQPSHATSFVNVIHYETERMIRLVSDLLQLSKFDSRRQQLKKKYVDIEVLLNDVVDRFHLQCKKKSLHVTVQVAMDDPLIWIDRDGIDRVLDNLVSNAIKSTLEKGNIYLIAQETLQSRAEGGQMEICIQDTGVGIPKKDLERIFERFYRVDKARSRKMGGTGLGLSIAREIIQAHGGEIKLDSQLNVGTTATIVLPLHREGGGKHEG